MCKEERMKQSSVLWKHALCYFNM